QRSAPTNQTAQRASSRSRDASCACHRMKDGLVECGDLTPERGRLQERQVENREGSLLPDLVREPLPQRPDDDRGEETDGREQDDRDGRRDERMRERYVREAGRDNVFDEAE